MWTAFDTKLKRLVALKRPHGVVSAADREQFEREAQIAAQVQHPNLIAVFDAVDGWLVMEHLASESLDHVLTRGPLPPERVARIGVQIAAALAAVHERDIVHRDVKPGNVLVAAGDLAKLTDFGISVWREVTGFDDVRVSGTPAYTAPEVAAGQPAGPASDVFSLGATLYAALAGAPPFGGGAPTEVLERARAGEIPPLEHDGPLAGLLMEMLDRKWRRRPAAAQVRQRLQEITGAWEPPVAAPKRPFWRRRSSQLIGAGVVACAVVASVVVAMKPPPAAGSDLVGDERMADPCALLSLSALRKFGPRELRTDYGNFNRCDVLIDVGEEEKIDVEVQLVTKASQQIAEDWRLVPDTPFSVYLMPSDDAECNRMVVVDDKYGVRLTAKMPNSPIDLCTVADVAVDNIKDTLREGQIPRRRRDFPAGSAARINVCGLLPAQELPGFNPGVDVFGGWSCKWFAPTNRTKVSARYDQHSLTDSIKGKRTTLGGHDAYVQYDTDTSQSCTVQVPYQPANGAERTTLDVLMLSVLGDRKDAELCPEAQRLAMIAARNLHR